MKNEQKTLKTAQLLAAALPYIQQYQGKTMVVKYGGNAMGDNTVETSFARDIVLMKQCKVNPIIVHGGGPMINDALDKWKIDFDFIEGKRITDDKKIIIIKVLSVDSNINSSSYN